MWTQQVLVLVVCLSLAIQQINAVVTTGANAKDSISANIEANSENNKEEISDLIAASSETEADKREAVIDLTGIFGSHSDTYLPTASGNLDLPIPIYGAPNSGSNIVYPAPPPDIPPPLSSHYGVPNGLNLPAKEIYGPPKFSYGPPKHKRPRIKYGPSHFRPSHLPKPIYGPPRKPYFPKPIYGPPKYQYGPSKQQYNHPKPSKPVYIPPVTEAPVLNPPPTSYGSPNINLNIQPAKHYGPPEPEPQRPPPGVPAPPTPPDIKYDGWQPIPGLVSKPPSGNYGSPHQHSSDLDTNPDFTPPQEGTVGIDSLGLQDNYKSGGTVSDSYGAPLNTVTGSGGVVQISGEAHHQGHRENFNFNSQKHQDNKQGSWNYHQGSSNHNQGSSNHHQGSSNYHQGSSNHHQGSSSHHQGSSNYHQGSSSHHQGSSSSYAQGVSSHHQGSSSHNQDVNFGLSAAGLSGDNSLSLVKSVGYELQNPSSEFNSYSSELDSYSSPPSNSFSSEGSYPSAKGHKFSQSQFLSQSFDNVNAAFGSQHFSKDIGLIPPSGVYGSTPSSEYGTSLFQPANEFKALPKRPVFFREPVPTGFIQAGASESAHNQAHGIDTIQAAAYNSPPIDSKPVNEDIPEPSSLYSLPHIDRPVSFQNVVHGSSSAGLLNELNFNVFDNHHSSFGGGSYASALQSSLDSSLQSSQQSGYDFSNGYSNNFGYQHDCNSHSSQPLPQVAYGVPSGNSYASSLSSLHTNVGNVYGPSDLSASHSVKVSSTNSISEAAQEVYAKSFGGSLASGGELIKSQSIDLNNIPLQGALGTYTLQIQSADGLGGVDSSPSEVSHEQVLNDGLLESILAAIEQPQHQSQVVNNNVHVAYNHDGVSSRSDVDSEASLKHSVIVAPRNKKGKKENNEKFEKDNKVAVYLKKMGGKEEDDER